MGMHLRRRYSVLRNKKIVSRIRSPRATAIIGAVCIAVTAIAATTVIKNLQPFRDPTGFAATFNTAGDIVQANNPFFQSLGTNGRSCASCHLASDAFALSAASARNLFMRTHGNDPLFAPVDGANCPNAQPGDARSRSLLLQNGLIRVSLPIPQNAQFSISVVRDPYGCAFTTDPKTGQKSVSVYRRPLPSTNLRFLSAVMFDGRETVSPLNDRATFSANLVTDLRHQALDATLGHAQASTPPSDSQLSSIVAFEMGLFSAQVWDDSAQFLAGDQVGGGSVKLSSQNYYPGINDSLGADPNGLAFNRAAFALFTPWLDLSGGKDVDAGRKAIAAGEQIFNTAALTITNVRGLNDNSALGSPATITGTCTTCHDTPNVGNHSLPLPLDIGTSHPQRREQDVQTANALAQLGAPDLPVYKIAGCPDPFSPGRTTVIYTSDPGRALITGQCSDVNRIKGPILRGLAARAPYFHNGAAATLSQLVNFYDERFQMRLTDEQKKELIAFLNSL